MAKSSMELLDAAWKAITTGELGESTLVPQQAERFIRAVEKESVLLGDTRRLGMTAKERNIDRTGFGDRILQSPQAEGTEFTGETTPGFFTNVLNAMKGRGRVSLTDESIRENLQREGFEDLLVDMIGSRSSLDLEEALLAGDTSGSTGSYLDEIDGWLLKAGQSLAAADFDDPADIEIVFDTMLLALDDKYLRNLDEWRFYCSWAVENKYRDTLRERQTGLGDTAQTGGQPLVYKGIRLQRVPMMPTTELLLTNRNNAVYGIRSDVQIERERVAKADRWDFHVRVHADCHYEEEDGAVAASGITI